MIFVFAVVGLLEVESRLCFCCFVLLSFYLNSMWFDVYVVQSYISFADLVFRMSEYWLHFLCFCCVLGWVAFSGYP